MECAEAVALRCVQIPQFTSCLALRLVRLCSQPRNRSQKSDCEKTCIFGDSKVALGVICVRTVVLMAPGFDDRMAVVQDN